MAPDRILLTGAEGFVGGHLIAALRIAFPDAEVVATAHRGGARLTALDVTDAGATDALVRSLRPDAVVHLAGVTSVPAARREPDRAWQVNLHGTLNVARALRAHVPNGVVLFVSTSEVYGGSFRAGVPLDETAVLAPTNPYAASKAAADLALGAMASDGASIVRVRPFNHTGPGQSAEFVVSAFARQIARIERGLQKPVLDVGALAPSRDFLDVRDVCAAYVAVLQRAETLPGSCILNIASGTPRRIGDVLEQLLRIAGVEAEIVTANTLLRATDIAVAVGDATRATALLDWHPDFAWDTTLRDVLADWRARVATEQVQ